MEEEMIFKTSIDKLSRGCGKEFSEGNDEFMLICGKLFDFVKPIRAYCPSCQSQLTLLQNLSKQEEDKIIEFVRNHPQAITQGYLDLFLQELSGL